MSNELKIDLDKDITYEGNTREERRLNKELLQSSLEVSYYQDRYDNMLSVDEVKEKIKNIKGLMNEEYLPDGDIREFNGWIDALEWVLNGSKTADEKLSELPKASKEQIAKVIDSLQKRYKQLSLFDEEVQNE